MLRSKLSQLREYLTPINHSSNFSKTGEISPEEFEKAGEFLTLKFPTWQWGTTPEKLRKDFLPPDKQFLVSTHVPSYERAGNYLKPVDLDEEEEMLEDGWVKSEKFNAGNNYSKDATASPETNSIQDIDELIDENAEEQDSEDDNDFEQLVESHGDTKLRRYNLYITYSTSYRVPKVYLVGFNANGIPLLPEQMFEDIASDYRDKTATIEDLPVAFNTKSVSIHPCKHSSVMRVLMLHAEKAKRSSSNIDVQLGKLDLLDINEADEQSIRVDQYLIVFLKFIAGVIPGIEYDYTMDAL